MRVDLPATIPDQPEEVDGHARKKTSASVPMGALARNAPPEILKGKTVLLVDDSPSNLLLYESMLEGYGLRLMTATNGSDALEAIEEKRPDAILMDLQMPVMNGVEAARRLREQEESQNIPVFALSGLSSSLQDPDADLFDGFLEKPIDVDTLVGSIMEMLGWEQERDFTPGATGKTSSDGILGPIEDEKSDAAIIQSLRERLTLALSSLPSSERDSVIERLQELISRTEWLRHQQSVTQIEELGLEIADLADAIGCSTLATWGRSLTDFAATFNLSEMNRYLDHLQKLKPVVLHG